MVSSGKKLKTENGQDTAHNNPNSPYGPITSFWLCTNSEKGKFLKALSVEAHKENENSAFS